MQEDIFHKEYRELSASEKELLKMVKDKATELLNLINTAKTDKNARLAAIATTHLETAVMYTVKAISE